ncbi:MTH938/NDUFAF3 family protein [Bradyrhizobium sp. NAS96.2]|uniref:Mth938-like domain-containing protein n=1 Tax=Bradyrhizobium sp. NAS96.2 TaxID=1680160 RepID=UPI001AECBDD7|nr:MTH938/NDUFAF3 family protein [Bradyrhizobium sp. NAS96.2]
MSKDDGGVEAPYCRVLEYDSDWEEVTMKIDSTTFGTITIDGKTYEHDVVVRLSGEIVKRKKKLSKNLYGTSHVLSEDEAKFLFEKGCDQVLIGSGQFGNVHLSPEAEAFFERKGCKVLLKPTPEAIEMFNRSRARRIGSFT